jgi:hypothetical protein
MICAPYRLAIGVPTGHSALVHDQADRNEIGTAPPRGRPRIDRAEASGALSRLAGEAIELGPNANAFTSPTTCPACGSSDVTWGCDEKVIQDRNRIHPLVWHPTEWMADSFVCGTCDAGWIEPDDPEPVTWVRPYWFVGDA